MGQKFPGLCCWLEHLAFYRAGDRCTAVPDQLSLVGHTLLGGSQPQKPVTWEFSTSQGTYCLGHPEALLDVFYSHLPGIQTAGETVYTIHSFNPHHSHMWWNL